MLYSENKFNVIVFGCCCVIPNNKLKSIYKPKKTVVFVIHNFAFKMFILAFVVNTNEFATTHNFVIF